MLISRRGGRRSSRATSITVVAHVVSMTGGQERVTAELVRGLLKQGFSVTVVARRCTLAHPNLRVLRLPLPERPAALATPLFFFVAGVVLCLKRTGIVQTSGAIVPNRVDVATVHFCHSFFLRHVGAERAKRNTTLFRLNSWAVARFNVWAERWCYRSTRTRLLAPVSEGLAADLKSLFPGVPTTVIRNGVDADEFCVQPAERARMRAELSLSQELLGIFVGGDWERKGLRHAIVALQQASRWRLMVVGAGDTERYEQLARTCGVLERVFFVGRQSHTAAWFAAADAWVFPTTYEAFPLTVLEAASSGLPLIAPNVSGINEILVDEVTGLEVRRTPGEIARALVRLQDEAFRNRLGRAARTRALEFSWERQIAEYVHAYERFLSEPAATEAGGPI